LLVVTLIVCTIAIGGSAALAGGNARVMIGLPKNTVPKYDTIYSVTAKAYGTNGAYTTAGVIAWSASPDGVVAVHPSATGRSGTIEGLSEGTAIVRVAWLGFGDSALVHVTKARVVSLAMFTRFTFGPSGVVGVLDTPLVASGQTRCIFVAAYDRRGGSATGRSFDLKSGNPSILSVGTGDSVSLACIDTTIDVTRMGAFARVP
jgi:hypothetical protein